MLDIDARDALHQEEFLRQDASRRRRQLCEVLEQQKLERRRARELEAQEEREWGQRLQLDADRHLEETRLRQHQAIHAKRRFMKERVSQIKTLQRRRQEDARADALINRAMQESFEEMGRKEAALEEERRRWQQKAHAEIADDRRLSTMRKTQSSAIMASLDENHMLDQRRLLDKQEQARREHSAMVKGKKPPSAPSGFEFGDTIAHRAARENEWRATIDQEERRAREAAAAEDKRRQREREFSEDVARVAREQQERSRQRVSEIEDDRRRAADFRKDAQMAAKEENEAFQRKRGNETLVQMTLKKQMAETSPIVPGRFGHEQMNEAERRINRDKVQRILGEASMHR